MMRLLLILMLLASPVLAVEPDEVLQDPILEERAREISKGLRCLVCRNESIDESNASFAKDMRLIVRERLVEGDKDSEVVDFIVERYGEYVLLNPPATGSTLLLWLAGPFMLLISAGAGFVYVRRRAAAPAPQDDELNEDEARALRDILDK